MDASSQSIEISHENVDSPTAELHTPLYMEDYIFRGSDLEEYSIYELAELTYAKGTTERDMNRYVNATESAHTDRQPTWNRRVFFQSGHSKAGSRWISFMRRPKIPCIVGTILLHIDSRRPTDFCCRPKYTAQRINRSIRQTCIFVATSLQTVAGLFRC